LSLFVAAVHIQYPSATEMQINSRIGAFLAVSGPRWGEKRKRTEETDSAAGISHVADLSNDGDVEDD